MRSRDDGYWARHLAGLADRGDVVELAGEHQDGQPRGLRRAGGTGGSIRAVGGGQARHPVKPVDGRVIHWLTVRGANSRGRGNAAIA